ncbi:MAG: ABC transporter permease [Lachnospiraceae bacterium]|nr:ABC transporter permease [Lachnospiraceae bacterium]
MTGLVFRFSLRQQIESKSFRTIAILMALLCLFLPMILLPALDRPEDSIPTSTDIQTAYCVDLTDYEPLDWKVLRDTGNPVYEKIAYEDCGKDLDKAAEMAALDSRCVVLVLDRSGDQGAFTLHVLSPKESEIEEKDRKAYQTNLERASSLILTAKAGVDEQKLASVDGSIDVEVSYVTPAAGSASGTGITVADAGEGTSQQSPAAEDASSGSAETGTQTAETETPGQPETPTVSTQEPGGTTTITVTTAAPEETEESKEAEFLQSMRSGLAFAIPYINIMLLYFLILFFGQGVANSILLEKNNKLMDTFLVNVKTDSLIIGKVFAVVCAALGEFFFWILCLIGGFAGGFVLIHFFYPGYESKVLRAIHELSAIQGLLSPAGILPAVLLICFGFLLYCSLASIGGALAGKQEDLASTNTLFTLALVASFLAVLMGGGISGNLANKLTWMDFVPFTAVLVTPAKLMLGGLSPLWGYLALLITLVCAVVIMVLASKCYRLMVFYKGDAPKIQDLPKLFKASQS